MPAVLPVCFLLITVLLAQTKATRLDLKNRRETFIAGTLLFGFVLAAGTGLLSLFQAIRFSGIALFWITLCLIGGSTVVARRQYLIPSNKMPLLPLSLSEKILLGGWAVLAATLFLMAASTAPNSWDAMVYHLSRVEHWIHNRNVAYFPTPITRELWAMPWAEYMMLHLQVLGGSDRWANCVQWAGWTGSCVGVSLIAQQLGASRKGQIAAMLFAATIPMGILQSTSTKNDLPTAFWLVSTVWAILKWLQEGQKTSHVLLAATAAALALFTKGSSYLFLPPFILIAILLAPKNAKKITSFIAGILLGVIMLTGFFHVRNRLEFNRWNPAKEDVKLENETMSVPLFISNLVRHSAVHLQTPSQKLNNLFIRAIRGSYKKLGVDFYDPRITHYLKEELFLQKSTVYNEYYAGNFMPFLLGIICCATGLFWRWDDRGLLRLYILAIVTAYTFFVLYMRWQPWISRLHLPLFILGTPIIAVVLDRAGSKQRILVATALIFILAATPWILKNKMRPLVGKQTIFNTNRPEQYFLDRPYMYQPFLKITAIVKHTPCRKVGLILKDDYWEYPYWVFLQNRSYPVDIRHIQVENPSQRYDDQSWQPCAIISEIPLEESAPLLFRGRTYLWQDYQKPLNVYIDKTIITNPTGAN